MYCNVRALVVITFKPYLLVLVYEVVSVNRISLTGKVRAR